MRPIQESRLTRTGRNRRWWTLAGMCLALFMSMLDTTVVTVALPSIQRDLQASASSLELTVNVYTLAFALLLVTGGRLGDLFGRRRVFVFGVVVFALASLLIAFSPSEVWLIACRGLQGVGAGFMMPGTLSIITNAFPPDQRGKAIGIWAGVSALALAVGPILGGVFVEELSWQSVFLLNVPVAALAIGVTIATTRESRDEDAIREVDVPGVVSLTVSLAALLIAVMQSNAWGWSSPRVLALFALAAVALAAFVAVEQRRRAPMLDFRFFRSVTFLGANVVAFLLSFVMFATFFSVTLYMQNTLGYSPLQTGLRFLPMTVLVMLAAPVAGYVADRIGPRPVLTAGMLGIAASLFWLTGITTRSSYGFLVVSLVLMGLGVGSVISPMSTAAMNSVHAGKAGVASGILGMTRMLGATFGVAALGAIVASVGTDQLRSRLSGLGDSERARLVEALGSGDSTTHLSAPLQAAMNEAYVHALTRGLYAIGAVALLGALLGWAMVSESPAEKESPADPAGIPPLFDKASQESRL